MSTPSQQLYQLISKGNQQLVALCDLCERERAAIEAHSAEQLKAVVNDKKTVLLQITENISQRNQILADGGFSADETGFNGFTSSLNKPEAVAIQKAWSKLAEQLKQVAKLNERNEKIVQRSQKNMAQLLGILQGHSTKTTLYNQAGSKGNYSAQNRLGKA
ncbi:MAG: flagellar protein FlgN [Motiliproteus sp.]|nr:flagellar protein FlgN [Motiliproteus sp.]MCW9051977.1 flagellar protein FlgN [Motiliproteus sp.]